jgi:hypothetical protein
VQTLKNQPIQGDKYAEFRATSGALAPRLQQRRARIEQRGIVADDLAGEVDGHEATAV